jgi:hypothetical protein
MLIAVSERHGRDFHLLHDVHHRLTRHGATDMSPVCMAAEHPYARAYLAVNRRLDGTVHPW